MLYSGSLTRSILEVKNLSKTYESGFKALKGVNLEIRRGEIFALLGPNGAGKTTLISIICGIASATEGTGLIKVPTASRTIPAMRSQLGGLLIGIFQREKDSDCAARVKTTPPDSRQTGARSRQPG